MKHDVLREREQEIGHESYTDEHPDSQTSLKTHESEIGRLRRGVGPRKDRVSAWACGLDIVGRAKDPYEPSVSLQCPFSALFSCKLLGVGGNLCMATSREPAMGRCSKACGAPLEHTHRIFGAALGRFSVNGGVVHNIPSFYWSRRLRLLLIWCDWISLCVNSAVNL